MANPQKVREKNLLFDVPPGETFIKPHETSSRHTAPTNDETTKSPEVLLPSNHSECSISSDNLVQIRKGASSSKNFAVHLMREMFQHTELVGRNICGMRGKMQVDPSRVKKIKELMLQFYPTAPSEREVIWRNCRKAMDSYLRKLPHNL